MNLIQRLTTSVTATLDSAVNQIENHDAIIDATIKQTRQAAAKTKARINTLCQQEKAYTDQLREAREQQAIWTERATRLATADQEKALQCVSRRNQVAKQIDRLTLSIEQQKELISNVTLNLQTLQRKLDDMSYKHNLMRSRQAVADVNRAMARSCKEGSFSDTFERWESVILEHELAVSEVCSRDALARDALDSELSQHEGEAALLAQLAELTGSEKLTDTKQA